jgi:hypothetical protein
MVLCTFEIFKDYFLPDVWDIEYFGSTEMKLLKKISTFEIFKDYFLLNVWALNILDLLQSGRAAKYL